MKKVGGRFLVCALFTYLTGTHLSAAEGDMVYPWIVDSNALRRTIAHIPAPPQYRRLPVPPHSFGIWLRGLPLCPPAAPIRLHSGALKGQQAAHYAVVDIDTGPYDRQRAADAIIRLRAEYLFATGPLDTIQFSLDNGTVAAFTNWAAGQRPDIRQDRTLWTRRADPAAGYSDLRAFLDTIFLYADTGSLSRDLNHRPALLDTQPGDVLVDPGSPGHAAMIIDVAEHGETGERICLLAQSGIPAQDIHIPRNLAMPELSPWFALQEDGSLRTPAWTFHLPVARCFGPPDAP